MKSYALVAYFSNEIEDKIIDIWKSLNELKISSYGVENKERRPHITFADYDSLNLEEYLSDFELYFGKIEEISVNFSVIGSFVETRTLFLMDPANTWLRISHQEYHSHFNKYPAAIDSKYIPNSWIPHCTIASRLNENKMLDAYAFCTDNLKILTGSINEFGLLELTHDLAGKVIKDLVIKKVKLKTNDCRVSE